MASCRITNFNQRIEVLRRISRKYVSWRFEWDELVDQMWLSRNVREAQWEHQLVRVGLNAMFDYFRNELGRYKPKPTPQRLTNDPILEDDMDDTWMDFDSMSKGWTFTQRVIVKLRADWFTWPEVAKLTGLSRSNARYQLSTSDKGKLREWAAV